MEVLVESFPFVFGLLLGLTSQRLGGLRARWPVWAVASVALGSFATFCSGEYLVSPVYFLLDSALVGGVCVATALFLQWRAQRGAMR